MERQPATSLGRLAANELRDRLRDHLRTRNGICHGLEGISSSQDGKPAALTWTIAGETHTVAWDDLQVSFAWLSRVPRAIFTISNASSEAIGNRFSDDPDNRAWWFCEFGLDLSDVFAGSSAPTSTQPSGPELPAPDAGLHPPASARD